MRLDVSRRKEGRKIAGVVGRGRGSVWVCASVSVWESVCLYGSKRFKYVNAVV